MAYILDISQKVAYILDISQTVAYILDISQTVAYILDIAQCCDVNRHYSYFGDGLRNYVTDGKVVNANGLLSGRLTVKQLS